MGAGQNTVRDWLQVLRPWEILTIPGAVLAGAALSDGLIPLAGGPVAAAVGVGLLIGAGGWLLNDWLDRQVDVSLHPERPLAAGRLSGRAVLGAGILAMVAALTLAAATGLELLATTLVLTLLTLFYQTFARKVPYLGTLVRAVNHGLYLLLGAAIMGFPGSQAGIAALVFAGCVLCVGWMAPGRRPEPAPRAAIIVFCLTPLPILFTSLNRLTGPGCIGVWIAIVVMLANVIYIALVLWRQRAGRDLVPLVPWLYRHLIFIQAIWVAVGTRSNCVWVAGVMLLWPIAWRFSRFFGNREW